MDLGFVCGFVGLSETVFSGDGELTCVLETALFLEVFELPTPASLQLVLASIRCDSGFLLLLWLGQEQGLSLIAF